MKPNKVMVVITILFAAIISFGVYSQRVFNNTAVKVESHLNKVEQQIKDGSWDAASDELKAIADIWSKAQNYWAIMLDHFEIDNIDTTLERLEKYVDGNDMPSSLAEAATLRKYIAHIPEKEALKLKNIF